MYDNLNNDLEMPAYGEGQGGGMMGDVDLMDEAHPPEPKEDAKEVSEKGKRKEAVTQTKRVGMMKDKAPNKATNEGETSAGKL